MATRSSQRSSRSALRSVSALAFAAVLGAGLAACQSGDGSAGGDETERREDERPEDETPDAPRGADVASVPARSSEPAAEESSDEDDADEAGAAGGSEASGSEADTPSESDAPAAEDTQAPVAAAQTFAACWTDSGPYSDCESIYVTVTQAAPGRCIQLTIDNCGTYGRQGLGADTPATWRLAGGSIGAAAAPCEFGVFYSGSTSVADATGSVSWDETTSRPSALQLELSLEPTGVAEPIALATPEPLQITECDE